MKQNIADLPDLVRMAKRYGASSIYVMQLLTRRSCRGSPDSRCTMRRSWLWRDAQGALLGFLYGIHVSVPHRFANTSSSPRPRQPPARAATRLARLAFLGLVALRTKGFKRMAEILFFGFGPRAK